MTITLATKRDIARAYADGLPTKVIAHEYGISNAHVSRVAISQGITPRLTGRPAAARAIDEEAILGLFRGGLDTISIAARLCIRPSDAANALARARDRGRSK